MNFKLTVNFFMNIIVAATIFKSINVVVSLKLAT